MRRVIVSMALLVSLIAQAEGIVRNVIARQIQPWGLVEIRYELTKDVSMPQGFVTKVVCEDCQHSTNYTAHTFVKPPTYERGQHKLLWDARADGVVLKSSDVVFRVTVETALYCVVDVSGGISASRYPVSLLADTPSCGWTDEYKTTKIVLRYIEPGTFKMNGSYDVALTNPYFMGVFEVSRKQYDLVTGATLSHSSDGRQPVSSKSWNAVKDDFIVKLCNKTGLVFDLPTEAQWEYACRAGTTTMYSYGDDANGEYMWYSGNSGSETHEVGTRKPNGWGLYDMHGNLWEWCLDWYGCLSSSTEPTGPSSGSERVVRGCSFDSDACASSIRYCFYPSYGVYNIGFRLVKTIQRSNN